jgi:hypothetical protein
MESNKNVKETKTAGGSDKPSTSSGHSSTGTGGAGQASSAPQRARELASDVSSGVQTAYDQTVKAVGEAYDKTSEVLTNTYDQTMTYGRDNPGKLTLIAFGAGIGIGVLLASGFGGRRSNGRYTEPIVNALSQVALEFFR